MKMIIKESIWNWLLFPISGGFRTVRGESTRPDFWLG